MLVIKRIAFTTGPVAPLQKSEEQHSMTSHVKSGLLQNRTSDAEQVLAHALTYPSPLITAVLWITTFTHRWACKQVDLFRLASQSWKEWELSHS